jgi:hypothetical protein
MRFAEKRNCYGLENVHKPFEPLTIWAPEMQIGHSEKSGTTAMDRTLLRQALNELVRLKSSADNPTRFLALLYSSALNEWAGELGVDRHKLHKLVHIREAVSARRFH